MDACHVWWLRELKSIGIVCIAWDGDVPYIKTNFIPKAPNKMLYVFARDIET